MAKTDVIKDYVWSAFWIVIFLFLSASCQSISHIILFDFVHGNSNRTLEEALITMIFGVLLFSTIGIVVFLMTFTLPIIFQAIFVCLLINRHGKNSHLIILPMLPFSTVFTWYCYDYLVPTSTYPSAGDVIYEHGLSLQRYGLTFFVQMAVSVFTLLYSIDRVPRLSKRRVVLVGGVISVTIGLYFGYVATADQIRLQVTN